MKKTLRIIALLSFLFIFWLNVFAGNSFTKAPELKEATTSSLEVNWEKIDSALWYYIYYWTKSSTDWKYEFEWNDIIDWTWTKLNSLKPNTKYFVQISAVNEDAEEFSKTTETSFTTSNWAGNTWNDALRLENIRVNSINELQIKFNLPVSKDWNSVFKIISKKDSKEIQVDSKQVSSDIVALKLKDNLEYNTEYDLTVVTLTSENGKNIESWVYWASKFVVPTKESLTVPVPEENIELNSAVEKNIELNSGSDASWSLAWAIVKLDNENSTEKTAEKVEKLPNTWPETFFIFFLAMLLSILVFMIKRKKIS